MQTSPSLKNQTNKQIKESKPTSPVALRIIPYSLHQKNVYTCVKDKYSKARGTRGKIGISGLPSGRTNKPCYFIFPKCTTLLLICLLVKSFVSRRLWWQHCGIRNMVLDNTDATCTVIFIQPERTAKKKSGIIKGPSRNIYIFHLWDNVS